MGIYWTTQTAALKSKFGLIPAYILLNFWQRQYTYCFLSFLTFIFTKHIIPITLQIENGNSQLEDQLKNNKNLATHQKNKNFGQHSARQVLVKFYMDLIDRVESVLNLIDKVYLGQIFIQESITAILKA